MMMDSLHILRSILLIALIAAPLPNSHAFQISHHVNTRPLHRGNKPLQIAASASNEQDPSSPKNSAMLRQIDQKIQRYEKQQQKYLERLNSAKAELQKFKETKQKYLTGGSNNDLSTSANFSETTPRSLVKSMLWRLIAGSVTFFTSLRFSQSLPTALSIVSSDFFSKAATMFIGERLMNKSQAGRQSGADDVGRSLAKALLWRLFAICNTLTMSFLIAKNFRMASKIAGSDAVFKTGLMFVYERVWARVEWGKEYIIEFSI